MKKLNIVALLFIFLAAACKKDINDALPPIAGMNVINAVLGGVTVKVNPGISSGFAYSRATLQVGYGANTYYDVVKGSKTITAVNAADTTKTLFTRTINIQERMNTLYLFGTYPAIDTLFREEKNIPFAQTTIAKPDSILFIRFVNLSPNAGPVNIKIAGVNEVSALSYKGVSAFKQYSANSKASTYNFEVRDAVSDALLLSTSINPGSNRYRTISLIIRGQVNPAPPVVNPYPLGISQINYF